MPDGRRAPRAADLLRAVCRRSNLTARDLRESAAPRRSPVPPRDAVSFAPAGPARPLERGAHRASRGEQQGASPTSTLAPPSATSSRAASTAASGPRWGPMRYSFPSGAVTAGEESHVLDNTRPFLRSRCAPDRATPVPVSSPPRPTVRYLLVSRLEARDAAPIFRTDDAGDHGEQRLAPPPAAERRSPKRASTIPAAGLEVPSGLSRPRPQVTRIRPSILPPPALDDAPRLAGSSRQAIRGVRIGVRGSSRVEGSPG